MPKKPETIEEAIQAEVEAIARVHARKVTEDMRARGLLKTNEEVVWEWTNPESEEPPE